MKLRVAFLCFLSLIPLINGLRQFNHHFHTLTRKKTSSVASCCDVESLFDNDLKQIAKVRVSDTSGHAEVKEYIIDRLNQLDTRRWKITLDEFDADTPLGNKHFTNIIATLDPEIPSRIVLSAHYDSKYFANGKFIGATDSALSVALILDLILTLDSKLLERKYNDRSIQLILFDGEEAFVKWSETDSLYGSRHLAEEMSKKDGLLSVGGKTALEAIEALILLDLIGAAKPYPKIHNSYSSGENGFAKLISIEKRLHDANQLVGHTSSYFVNGRVGYIEDDHIPFYRKGVPIIHVIPAPFPEVWHKLSDNVDALDKDIVQNFKKIFMLFLYEYFHLQ